MRESVRLLLFGALLTAAGCATQVRKPAMQTGYVADGLVTDNSYIPEDATKYPEIPGAVYLKLEAAPENQMPTYPQELLSKKLPAVVVVVKAIVNTGGSVDSAELVDGGWIDPAIRTETIRAVRTWRFTPLRRVVNGKTELLPTTEHFILVFSQINGRPTVKPGA